MLSRYFSALFTSAILLTASCTKKGNTGPTGPAGPAGPAYTGAISGHVSLYDQYGSKMLVHSALIQLTLKGGRTINPDSSGYYVFDSVATGTYNITVSGHDIGTTIVNNIQSIKDTFYQNIKVSSKPSFNLTSFTASAVPSLSTPVSVNSLSFRFPSDVRVRNIIVFAGKDSTVSNDPATYLLAYTKTIAPSMTQASITVYATDLNYARIFYGETVHYAAYSYVVNDASVFVDPVTGRNVYNAVGTRLTDTTIAP
ncbi:MAG: hypothetical protein V4649_10085 [Bacteroidota bacterium]